MNRYLYFLFLAILMGCISDGETEKYQGSRNNIVNAKTEVKEISIDEVLIGSLVRLEILNDWLIIHDCASLDTLIQIFDKNHFIRVGRATVRGEGPKEITNMGNIIIDKERRLLHITDFGKNKIFFFSMDSILNNPSYFPKEYVNIKDLVFPDRYMYFNDTLCLARIITKKKGTPFQQSLAFWNMKSGDIRPLEYAHPEVERKRATFIASREKDLIVECYSHHDLMTICDFQGHLKYNIYGSRWDNRMSNRIHYYDRVCLYKDKIIAAYSGGDNMTEYEPTCFLIFDLEGNYIKTINIGYRFQDYCIDEENNRIIMAMNEDFQFAYWNIGDHI